MSTPGHAESVEEQIGQWRTFLRRRQAIHAERRRDKEVSQLDESEQLNRMHWFGCLDFAPAIGQ